MGVASRYLMELPGLLEILDLPRELPRPFPGVGGR